MIAGTAEERRVVTVLFADLVGYTALSEHLDPERVKRLIDAAFTRLIGDINAFGGRVDKLLGDGILALFGAPVAHEDDADRAIRTALQMHETIAKFVEEQADLEVPLRLRVGVNTGEVLVGTVSGTAEYTAMGDVVNVASRLQTMAPAGGIYIGDSTASLATNEILRELVDDVEVRGRSQTERVWRVVGHRPKLPKVGSRSDLPFVGRSSEAELLTSILTRVANGQSAVVAVSGEAGSGKTRLVGEALAKFPSRNVVVLSGVCAPYGESNVWAPITVPLFHHLGFDAAMPPDQLRTLSRARGAEIFDLDRTDLALDGFVEAVAHLLGHPSDLDHVAPNQAREALFSFAVEGFRRLSRNGPVVVWIDDLQWASALILDLLHHLARSLADRPVLTITAQRDDAELDWPPAVDHPITIRMPLDPLTRVDSDRLIAAMLGSSIPTELAAQLFERSGGNPLYLTELAELARSNPDSTDLTGSLRALIAARLDRLAPGPRVAIDNAAVLGTTGSLGWLERFAAELGQQFFPADVDALVDDGLIEVNDDRWSFRSDVVREVAYQTLTKLARAQRHAGTAVVMVHDESSPLDQVAHHAATAAELVAEIGPVPGVAEDIGEQAVRLLCDAVRRSLDVGAFVQAQRLATRALDLQTADVELSRELLLLRSQVEMERRLTDPARTDAEQALADAIEFNNERHEGMARRILGNLHQRSGDIDAARRELEASADIFGHLGDDIEMASSLRELGMTEIFGGSLARAEQLLEEAETLSEQLNDRRGCAWVRQHQAWVAFLAGDTKLAETRLLLSSAEFEELGDRFGRNWAHGLLAWVRFQQRQFAEAETLALQVRADALELGDRWGPAMMDSLLASIRLWTSQFAASEELSRRALAGFRDLGDRFGMVQALAPRVRALVALGRTQEAERGLEEAMALSDSFGDLAFPVVTAAGAAVHLGLGDRAVVIGEIAVQRMDAMGANGSEVRVTLALALCQVGRADEALAMLLDVEDSFPYADAVHAIAAAMTGDRVSPIADAAEVWGDVGSTYLDRVLVDVAAAAVAETDSEVLEFLERARGTSRMANDVVAKAIVSCASGALMPGGDQEDVDHLAPGWHRVIHGLAGVDPHAAEASA